MFFNNRCEEDSAMVRHQYLKLHNELLNTVR